MWREKGKRAAYTVEFKLEAVHLIRGGQSESVTAKVLDIPKATLGNWVRRAAKGELTGAGTKPVSAEQMELARLRAELARGKMERDIPKKATAYLLCEGVSVRYAWITRHKWQRPLTFTSTSISASSLTRDWND